MRAALILSLLALLAPVIASAQAPPYYGKWGSFGAGPGQFQLPVGVAIGADGTAFVIDQQAGMVLAFTATGGYLRSWSSPAPGSVAVDALGRVWVGQYALPNRVRAYAPDGTLLQDWASPNYRVAPDPSGNIWVFDNNAVRVRLYTPNGTMVKQWGSFGVAPGQLTTMLGIAVDNTGTVYVSDTYHGIQVFTSDGVYLRGWDSPLLLDGASRLTLRGDATLLATNSAHDRVVAFTTNGAYLYTLGSSGTGPGQFLNPIGVGVGPGGAIYVADANNGRIQIFGDQTTPAKTTSWGALKLLGR